MDAFFVCRSNFGLFCTSVKPPSLNLDWFGGQSKISACLANFCKVSTTYLVSKYLEMVPNSFQLDKAVGH